MVPGTSERMSAGAGLLATLAVGVTTFAAGSLEGQSAVLWWVAYAVFALTFALDTEMFFRALLPETLVVAILVVSGMTVWLAEPQLGWSSVLLVVTAATAAYGLEPRWVAAVVVAQTIAVSIGSALSGASVPNVALTTITYFAFQAFAALVIGSARKEARAREELAVAHAELRASAAVLETTSRSAERLRIARELHDVLGHQLTALALELEVAAHRTTGDGLEHVTRARGIAKGLLTDVRATVGELRDAPVGLEPTLRTIVSDVPGLAVSLSVAEVRPLDEERTLVAVRCVQEALTNTLRHARATRLRIEVRSDAGGLTVRAEDDGRGTAAIERGNGLRGMAERVEAVGGTLTLASEPGRGFRLLLTVSPS
ncbi:sensor histidine kinase [Occultella aeris]|uniref:Oxygen sensor histidine kinase NreB n=1 Tax=Occultella aeris TaxID=2761496 RepID=A0A7M4DN79_9MICO|nr:sensor histidine kinase [Occultella aeris]VZO38889.1 Oxygen sensor histidine kinase NreB [Occultella aeris]